MQRCGGLQRCDSGRRNVHERVPVAQPMRLRARLGWVFGLAGALVACGGDDDSADDALQLVAPAELTDAADHVLDARNVDDFQEGHIEGACPIDEGQLRTVVDGIEGQAVSREDAWAVFGAAGLDPDDTVVVTAADNGTDPARIAWTLRYYGHQGDVLLLDGGMDAYAAQGLPVAAGTGPMSKPYQGGATRLNLRVDQQWMLDHLGDGNVAVFDVRAADEFASGHIPGAINVNWEDNKNPDGSFRSNEEVRALHGNPGAKTLVVYCRTGSRAAVSWALLTRAGYGDVRLYDGSWTEWGNDPDTPKERG